MIGFDRGIDHGTNAIGNLGKALLLDGYIPVADFPHRETRKIAVVDQVGIEMIDLEQAAGNIVWAMEPFSGEQQGIGLVVPPAMPGVARAEMSAIGEMLRVAGLHLLDAVG